MTRTLAHTDLRALLGVDAAGPPPPATPHQAEARYLTSLDGFDIKRPPIPPHVFLAERERALDPGAPTGLIPLDLSPALGLEGPATTPLILSRYARLRPGDRLVTDLRASAELHYALRGRGVTTFGAGGAAERIAWQAGDAFCLPGGGRVRHEAGPDGALLWSTTNEPQLAFEGCEPPRPGAARVRPAHYPGAEIRRRLLAVYQDPRGEAMAGKAIHLGNAGTGRDRTTTPTYTWAMNSLLPGEAQRGHRHNAVAVTLVVAGEACHSLIDGARVPWTADAVMITPPAAFHSHHNEGAALALFLIVQDGGLHYHCRTMGFSWT
jgi:gentisate 1,2-dioxygenase